VKKTRQKKQQSHRNGGLRAIAGHDTATLEAFSGGLGGHLGVSCQSIRHPVSLRLNAKRGIVTALDAAASIRIRA
jgi:hypothetical protein